MVERTQNTEEEHNYDYEYDDSLGTYAHPQPIPMKEIEAAIDEDFYFGDDDDDDQYELIEIGGVAARRDPQDGVLLDRVHVTINDGQQLNIHRITEDVGVEGVMHGTAILWRFDAGLDAFDAFLHRVDATVVNEDTNRNRA